ncbi:hypothetical protein Tco_1228237 [Tanacetum coccineum]
MVAPPPAPSSSFSPQSLSSSHPHPACSPAGSSSVSLNVLLPQAPPPDRLRNISVNLQCLRQASSRARSVSGDGGDLISSHYVSKWESSGIMGGPSIPGEPMSESSSTGKGTDVYVTVECSESDMIISEIKISLYKYANIRLL